MFQCESCHKQVGPGIPCNLIVRQAPCMHPHRTEVAWRWEWDYFKGRWKRAWYDDVGGPGTKIIREFKVCPECAKEVSECIR